jgi:hypothetical protein
VKSARKTIKQRNWNKKQRIWKNDQLTFWLSRRLNSRFSSFNAATLWGRGGEAEERRGEEREREGGWRDGEEVGYGEKGGDEKEREEK